MGKKKNKNKKKTPVVDTPPSPTLADEISSEEEFLPPVAKSNPGFGALLMDDVSDDELDAFMNESDAPSEEEEEEEVFRPVIKVETPKVTKKGKKKKNKKKAELEDIDSLLESLSVEKNESKPVESVEKKEIPSEVEKTEKSEETSEAPKKLTKNQLKKLKKKKNKEKAVETPVEKPKKGGISALKAKIERERKAREELERLEEERIRKKEEEERLRLEELRRIEEEKERKREEKRKKREKLRKEGKLLTKAQKLKKKKAEEMRNTLLAQKEELDAEKPAKTKPKIPRKPKKVKQSKRERFMALAQTNETNEAEETAENKTEPITGEVAETPAAVEETSDVSESSEESALDNWDMSTDEELEYERKKEEKRRRREEKKRLKAEKAKKAENAAKANADADAEKPSEPSEIPSNPSENIAEPASEASSSTPHLRSPICCILGHVDTGKTKILDRIRSTNVQDKEAGGITQQIGASYFPMSTILTKTASLNALAKKNLSYNVPGLLIIDTPGHESFTNLRSRGSSMCDIAILVVDIMHGLEPQTIESLNMLRRRKTPFIVALNKVDRLYDWHAHEWEPFRVSLKKQKKYVQEEFETRLSTTIGYFQEQGLNCELYYKNKDMKKVVSLVPTSAHTGEGLPDLLMLLVQLTQKHMESKLLYLSSLSCTVLEVKVIEGKGTTIDVILSNGSLCRNDTIVLCGLNGPIVTSIRALLTPAPLAEIRVKGEYISLDRVQAAAGVKIAAQGLEDAIAGSPLLVCGPGDDVEDLKDMVMSDLQSVLSRVNKKGIGVSVQASTLGSLEALLQFLEDMKIPVSCVGIGPIHKKEIVRASVMLERRREYACILAFDVPIVKEASVLAAERGVAVFKADIIYHLFDQFTRYMKNIEEEERNNAVNQVIFPCVVQIIPDYVFHIKDPIIVGVEVKQGILRVGTPLCVPDKDNLVIGNVVSIEKQTVSVNEAKRGDEVSIRIESKSSQIAYGRNFDHTNALVSKLSRRSIDLLKKNFKDVLSNDDWKLVIRLKKVFDII